MKATRKQCRKNGHLVSCKKKHNKTVSKRRFRRNARFVKRKKNMTKKRRVYRKKGRLYTQRNKVGGGLLEFLKRLFKSLDRKFTRRNKIFNKADLAEINKEPGSTEFAGEGPDEDPDGFIIRGPDGQITTIEPANTVGKELIRKHYSNNRLSAHSSDDKGNQLKDKSRANSIVKIAGVNLKHVPPSY